MTGKFIKLPPTPSYEAKYCLKQITLVTDGIRQDKQYKTYCSEFIPSKEIKQESALQKVGKIETQKKTNKTPWNATLDTWT